MRRGRWQKSNPQEPSDHALGRSRGGFSTKIHVVCDGNGLPLQFHLTGGQVHETQALDELLNRTDEAVVDLDNHKVAWPLALAGDKGYRADWIDKLLLELDILPVIPSKDSDNRGQRGVAFDRDMYRNRNIVERLIGWLKESRRIFSRFEKTAINFGGMIKLAFVQRYLRLMTE